MEAIQRSESLLAHHREYVRLQASAALLSLEAEREPGA